MNLWIDAGTLQPSNDWAIFPVSLISPVAIRLTYLTDWALWGDAPHRRSYGLIRFSYPTDTNSVSPSSRIYPKQEKEVRTLSDVLYSSTFNVQVRKCEYYRRYNVLPSYGWTIKLEYEQTEA